MEVKVMERSTFYWFKRGFLATALILLAGAALLQFTARAAAERSYANPNWEKVVYVEPDVILEGPDIDLEAYVRSKRSVSAAAYVSPLVIPAADFNRDSNESNYFFSFAGGYFGSGPSGGCYMAPVYLPVGATITDFFFSAYDNDGSSDIFAFHLRRIAKTSTETSVVLATLSTTGQSTNVQVLGSTTISAPVVSNDFTYYLTTCMFPSGDNLLRILAAWIFYTLP
jgi:hypothetical protein